MDVKSFGMNLQSTRIVYHISSSFEEGFIDLSGREVSEVVVADIGPTDCHALAHIDQKWW